MGNICTYKPFGVKAILIEWKPIIDEAILQDILEFKDKIKDQKGDTYLDSIVGYNSLTIIFIKGPPFLHTNAQFAGCGYPFFSELHNAP